MDTYRSRVGYPAPKEKTPSKSIAWGLIMAVG